MGMVLEFENRTRIRTRSWVSVSAARDWKLHNAGQHLQALLLRSHTQMWREHYTHWDGVGERCPIPRFRCSDSRAVVVKIVNSSAAVGDARGKCVPLSRPERRRKRESTRGLPGDFGARVVSWWSRGGRAEE